MRHQFGCGPLAPGEQPAPVSIFRHRLLHHFVLTLFSKLPSEPITTKEAIRSSLMVRIASRLLTQDEPVHEVLESRFGSAPLPAFEQPMHSSMCVCCHDTHVCLDEICSLSSLIRAVADSAIGQVRLLVCVFNFRMNRRLIEPDMPSFTVEIDHSATAREGCTVSTLSITSEPKDWKAALQVSCLRSLSCGSSGVCCCRHAQNVVMAHHVRGLRQSALVPIIL